MIHQTCAGTTDRLLAISAVLISHRDHAVGASAPNDIPVHNSISSTGRGRTIIVQKPILISNVCILPLSPPKIVAVH